MSLALEYKRSLGRLFESEWENLPQEDKEFWQKHDDYKERINAVLNRLDPATDGMAFSILNIISDDNGGYDKTGVEAMADMLVRKNSMLRGLAEKQSHAKWLCEHLLKDLR